MKLVRSRHLAELTIIIVGPTSLKNNMISFFLQEAGGAKCFLLNDPSGLEEISQFKPNRPDIVLWDMYLLNPHLIEQHLKQQKISRELFVVLLDLSPDIGIEATALEKGIRGFFYWNDPPNLLIKGLRHIQKGRLWISRAVFDGCLRGTVRPSAASAVSQHRLTKREEDVLRLTMRGYRNSEIAKSLKLSPNTVKTHLHRTFKKINVKSRMQAAKWAEHYLPQT